MLARAERSSPSPPFGVAWGPIDIILALGLALGVGFALVLLIVVPIAMLVGSSDDAAVLTAGLVATLLFDAALFGSAAIFSVVRYRCSWGALGLGPLSTKAFWPGVGTAVAALGIVVAYSAFVQLLGLDFLVPDPPDDLVEARAVLPLAGVAVVLVAPLAEETFFRGFVFGGLRRYGLFWAALASALLFSVPHINQGGAVVPFVPVGMLFAWSYSRTGSLWTAIYAHFWFNLVNFIGLAVIVQSGGSI